MAYQRPMVTVDQNMTTTPTSIERPQPAFIFGPNYELHRYADDSEKASTSIGTWEGAAMANVAYPGAIDADKVDTGYTKLFGDNVVVQVADLGAAQLPEKNMYPSDVGINGGYTKLLFSGKVYVDYDRDGNPVEERDSGVLHSLEKGDVVVVTYGSGGASDTIVTKITDVSYSASPWELDDSSASSEGPAGTLVTIEDAIPEAANVSVSGVVLADVLNGVEFTRKNYKDMSGWQWQQKDVTIDGKTVKGVSVNALYALDPAYFGNETTYGAVLYADLFLEYRELLDAYSDTFHSIVGASEVATALGTVDPDNPLAMGVYMACLNAATDDGDEAPPVYFMAVPTDDKDGYAKVLDRATLTDRAYVFAPTTQDEDVLKLVRNHVLEMSTKTVKMWRIAAASAKIPTEEAKLSEANVHGLPYYAIPVSVNGSIAPEPEEGSSDVKYNKFRIVKSTTDNDPNEDVRLTMYDLLEGDVILFNPVPDPWDEKKPTVYTVRKVVNNHTVEIKEADIDTTGIGKLSGANPSYEPKQIQIYHKRTAAQMAEAAASVSRFWASRRMLNVFPNYFEANGVTMTGEFAACAVAGLISSTEPQQPITNVTVRGIDEIPITNQQYNNADLDLIASGGTFIIAQDLPGDIVYVRHQITTAYPDGNLNTAELSITKNVDSISYAFAEVFRPYYGKYNITPELIAILENLAGQLISQLGGSTSVYGPQLIMENTKIRYVRQNPLMKDHVDIAITLGVPYPCNNIDIVLTV